MSHSALTQRVTCGNFAIGFIAAFSEWDLLGSLIKLVKVQSDSLNALKPTISYIVNNNRCMVQHLSKMIDCFYSLEDLTTR